MTPRPIDLKFGAAEANVDRNVGLRSAICIYLIGERPDGATIGELARLGLGGFPPNEEIPRVSSEVSQLLRDGEVKMEGEKVCPVVTD